MLKVFFVEVPSKWRKRGMVKSYGPPKMYFLNHGRPVLTSLQLLIKSVGTFIKQTFGVEKVPAKTGIFRFLRFFRKNLKVKNAYLGVFLANIEETK